MINPRTSDINTSLMITRHNVIGSALIGSFIAGVFFMHINVIFPIQIVAFDAAHNGQCATGTGTGNTRLGGIYTTDQYITDTRGIASNLFQFFRIINKGSLSVFNYIDPFYIYLKTSTTLINAIIGNNLAPAHIFLPTLRDVTSIIIEAKTYHRYDANGMILIGGQIMSLAILTIGARGVGPRFRPDQLSDLTWKDLLIFLFGILILAVAFMH